MNGLMEFLVNMENELKDKDQLRCCHCGKMVSKYKCVWLFRTNTGDVLGPYCGEFCANKFDKNLLLRRVGLGESSLRVNEKLTHNVGKVIDDSRMSLQGHLSS